MMHGQRNIKAVGKI